MNRLTSITLVAMGLAVVGDVTALQAQGRDAGSGRAVSRGASEVTSFIKRRSRCSRITNGDADDPGRVAENIRARFALKCSTLEDEEKRLRARYDGRSDVIEALDQDVGPDAAEEWFLPSTDP